MPVRKNISSGAAWESVVGYSRAVRLGPHVWVSGTTASDGKGGLVGGGDAKLQTAECLRKIERALAEVGARKEDVVRTRMFVTDIRRWEEIGRAHGELVGSVRPATTMVEVKALISPELLVEVEAEAFLPSAGSSAEDAP